tara:strand:- start:1448 stop:1906 length:459 start_codon:yes stop_codon:yes gene_type:complete
MTDYINKFNTKSTDDYRTPVKVWSDIKDYIPRDKQIWCPFYFNGDHSLKDLGYDIIHQNEDFFDNNYGDIVVDNPPFSIKKQVIIRLIELDKPFILTLPISTICYKYSRVLKDKLQIIIPNGRIKYTKTAPSFDSAYFCYKMNLPKDIIYLD